MDWLGILACAPGGGTTIRRCLDAIVPRKQNFAVFVDSKFGVSAAMCDRSESLEHEG